MRSQLHKQHTPGEASTRQTIRSLARAVACHSKLRDNSTAGNIVLFEWYTFQIAYLSRQHQDVIVSFCGSSN